MKKIGLCGVVLLIFLLALVVPACTRESTSPTSKSNRTKTSEQEKKRAESEPPGSKGELLVKERCTRCHNLGLIQSATFDRAGWERTVDHMIKLGAKLNEEEREVVIDYLSSR